MTDRSSLTTWLLSFYTIRFNDDTICFNIPLRTAMHAFPPLDTLHSNSSKQLILPLFSFQDCPIITYVPLIDMLWATIRAAYACSCCVANIEPSCKCSSLSCKICGRLGQHSHYGDRYRCSRRLPPSLWCGGPHDVSSRQVYRVFTRYAPEFRQLLFEVCFHVLHSIMNLTFMDPLT